jgi:hypothetical protein
MAAQQDALRLNFVLQKEKQEAERKRIEPKSKADFQAIVARVISPQALEWKESKPPNNSRTAKTQRSPSLPTRNTVCCLSRQSRGSHLNENGSEAARGVPCH